MIVSIALLGYALSGTFLSIYSKISEKDHDLLLTIASALFSLSILISYVISNNVPFDPFTIAWDNLQLIYIFVYYILLTTPFFLSGVVLALAIKKSNTRINTVYFSSFVGSALGSILILPLFKYLSGPGVIVLTSFIAGSSALFFALNLRKKTFPVLIVWLVILIVIIPNAGTLLPIKISPYKNLNIALRYPNSKLIETKWNAFSRVDVVSSGFVRYAPGLSLQYGDVIPEQIGIITDGDEFDAITKYDDSHSAIFTRFLPSAIPYSLLQDPSVLIIDAGGGLGVLTALHHNSSRINAVEENPIIIELVKEKYDTFSGSIYNNNKVEYTINDGRSYIQSTKEKFDLIELSMTGGASASSSGIYALSENYLYTVESFKTFMEHLSQDGFLSVSRWLLPPPREDVRIVSLALSALEALKVANPEKHIAVIRSWGTINLLVAKNQLNLGQINSIREFCKEMGFDIIFVPGIESSEVNIYNKFSEPIYYNLINNLLSEERDEFLDSYLYEISPSTDERPFFFQFFKWNRLVETYENLDKKWQALIEGGLLVPVVLLQALLLTLLLVILPLRQIQSYQISERPYLLLYFFGIGIGYMFIEITTIQRFILMLGHSVYSISIVLFSLLLSSSIGSYFSGRVAAGSKEHKNILKIVGFLSIFYGLLSPIIRILLGLSFIIRLFATFVIIMPLGFFMGMPFPLGIRLLSKSNQTFVTWAWAVNGCASVLGSILPVIIAVYLGFSKIFFIAGIMYLMSLLVIEQKSHISQ
jgi:MFS family permease